MMHLGPGSVPATSLRRRLGFVGKYGWSPSVSLIAALQLSTPLPLQDSQDREFRRSHQAAMTDRYYFSKNWKALRARALRRDNYLCTVPGCFAAATHVDHIVRRKDGGQDCIANLRSLCATHDAQLKELPNGRRRNGGKPRLIGCALDGWPRERGG